MFKLAVTTTLSPSQWEVIDIKAEEDSETATTHQIVFMVYHNDATENQPVLVVKVQHDTLTSTLTGFDFKLEPTFSQIDSLPNSYYRYVTSGVVRADGSFMVAHRANARYELVGSTY